jgi:MFS family permease
VGRLLFDFDCDSGSLSNFTVLLIGRLILGVGIGGDYPASGVIMAEYANTRNRGLLVGFTFIFYVFGQVCAYLVSLLVLAVGVPDHTAWRLILGFGVVPSLLVLYQRRHMPESPRWTAERGDEQQAKRDFEPSQIRVLKHSRLQRFPLNRRSPSAKPYRIAKSSLHCWAPRAVGSSSRTPCTGTRSASRC